MNHNISKGAKVRDIYGKHYNGGTITEYTDTGYLVDFGGTVGEYDERELLPVFVENGARVVSVYGDHGHVSEILDGGFVAVWFDGRKFPDRIEAAKLSPEKAEDVEKCAKFSATLDALDIATIEQLGGRARSSSDGCIISEDAADQLANVCRSSCGAAGGFTGFVYYHETREFFKANRERIAARLREQISDGLFDGARGVVSAVMSFNCLKGCDAAEIEEEAARAFFGPLEGFDEGALDNVANACAWAALEDLAFRLDGQRIEDDETAND